MIGLSTEDKLRAAQPLPLSKPYPNQLIEKYEKNIQVMVDHLTVTRGGYVKGFVPECRRQFILQYVNFRLRSNWGLQTELIKGELHVKEIESKQKDLAEIVQTETAIDEQAPVIGIGEL